MEEIVAFSSVTLPNELVKMKGELGWLLSEKEETIPFFFFNRFSKFKKRKMTILLFYNYILNFELYHGLIKLVEY